MTDLSYQIGFEYFPGTNSFSIWKIKSTYDVQGNIIGSYRADTKGFTCNMLDELKDYVGEDHPLVTYCETIWTQDIIDAYNLMMQQEL